MHKLIFYLYGLLFLLTPLVFFPKSSELFEFNKMVFVYTLTALIMSAWLIRSIQAKKFIFKHTILDLPLLLFLLSQVLATIFSIDRYTSVFGYYSRSNGGLLSSISYLLLYWAYVSNIERSKVFLHIKLFFVSGVLISIWGILEHFGHSLSCFLVTGKLDVDCWVQDVQARVFASLGQPNWLAAWLVALMPLTWGFIILKNKNNLVYHFLNLLFFITLLFTKSRSGIIAFAVAYIIFWGILLIKQKNTILRSFVLNISYLILATLLIGTPFTPSFSQTTKEPLTNKIEGPALETGGTESGVIRKIVWQGAVDLWREFPIFGTGVETFAYSYYLTRPVEHNLTTEWDFLYNKAHNEYLNFAANSGSVGIFTYIFLIILIIISLIKFKKEKKLVSETSVLKYALGAGFVSLLITNFFGFSVVVTNLEFFLLPAFGIVLSGKSQILTIKKDSLNSRQKLLIFGVLLGCFYSIFSLTRYWYADYQFARGRRLTEQAQPEQGIFYLMNAVNLNPQMATYHDQLANAYSQLAVDLYEQNEQKDLDKYILLAIEESDKAYALSPKSVTILKSRANIFTDLSIISPEYLTETLQTLQKLLILAPTDPSIYQRIGLALAQAGEIEKAIPFFEKAIELKPDYKRAKDALEFIKKAQ